MSASPHIAGTLALVGGAEWQPGCDFDADLLARAGGEVLVLPTAAAYEHPERAVATAKDWFGSLGGEARGLMVLSHTEACEESYAARGERGGFRLPERWLASPPALGAERVTRARSTRRGLAGRRRRGGIVRRGDGALRPDGRPTGRGYTVGLGLVEQVAVVPHHDAGASHHLWRTLELAPAGVAVVGIPERTAVIREPDGSMESCRSPPEGGHGAP